MSRRSSVSRKSSLRPWRSPSKPTDPQASLSLVYAEPENSIPGGAAAATTQQTGDPGRSVEPPLHAPGHHDAASSLRKASHASLRSLNKRARRDSATPDNSLNQETPAVHAHGEVPTMSTPSPAPVGVDQPSIPRPSNYTAASRQPVQRAGWFSSQGRKSSMESLEPEETTMRSVDRVAQSSPETFRTNAAPQLAIQPTTPESTTSESTPSTAVGIPFPAPDPRHTPLTATEERSKYQGGGWFSGKAIKKGLPIIAGTKDQNSTDPQSSLETPQAKSPASSIVRGPTPSQDIPQLEKGILFAGAEPSPQGCSPPTADHSVPSSVDDSVPVVSLSPPPASPIPVPVRPRERTISNLSSLNPSSSRFILSMPLLGRPKIPLDQVVTQVEQAEGTRESSGSFKGSIHPEGEKSDDAHDSVQIRQESVVSESSSWWGYIGLASSSTVVLPHSPLPDSPSSTAELQPSTLDTLLGVIAPHPPAFTETPIVPSIGSTEPAAAWYTPWRWYGGTTTPSAIEPMGTGKIQTELVKEEALARSEPSSSQSHLPLPDPSKPPDPAITSVESRASWISFFAPQGLSSLSVRSMQENLKAGNSKTHDDGDDVVPPPEVSYSSTTPNTKSPPSPTPIGPSEPSKRSTSLPPLTKNDDIKIQAQSSERPSSSSSKKSLPPPRPRPANLVLPTFEDIFGTPPRSIAVSQSGSTIRRAIRYVSGFLFPEEDRRKKWKGTEPQIDTIREELPRTWGVLGEQEQNASGGLKGVNRVVVIGIHGWFPGSIIRQVMGEPTGTSRKFANMLASAVEDHCNKHGAVLDKLTKIVLEGEGTIEQRVNSLYQEYLRHEDWVEDLQKADAILLATHSQGSIVSTQLLHRLINEGHIRTPINGVGLVPQRVCCVAMCGIHMGPLLYLNTSSLVNPYIQYFESAAARELFEFQDTESPVSQTYIKALTEVLEHGVKFTYIASLNDQVVPIYSGCFSTVAHPLILRALYIDGDAYNSSDFLSNLLVLLLRVRNAGLDDGGLITHLSEAMAGTLSGIGHSSAYEEPASYSLAVRFLFETSGALGGKPELVVQPFTARAARNDYEIPWALRDLIANPDVASLFSSEISELRTAFDEWHPRATGLRAIRRKLEPIRRLQRSRL